MQTQAPPSPLLTRREAAEYLRVSQRKLDSMIADGDLNSVKFGSAVRIPLAELDACITGRSSN